MDFFTHLTISLLISILLSGSLANVYALFGVLIGLLPDFDFAFFPLWKRMPLAGHHGITHTLVFILLTSGIIYAVLAFFFGYSDLKLLYIMVLTGSLHILGDFMGTGGVAPLYPLEKGYSSLNIDLGNNPFLMTFSFMGMIFLVIVSIGYLGILSMTEAAVLLGLIYIVYLVSRFLLKTYNERKQENIGFVALPTVLPWKWKFAKRIDTFEEIEIYFKTRDGIERYSIPKERKNKISTCQDLVYSYWHPMVQAQMGFFRYPYYRIICDKEKKEIIWNSVDMGKLTEVHVILTENKLKVVTSLRD
ncbi:MAG: metal-dependent hydrolase [Methanotrichaceae archaeon]|nr:metal-dependent hydrolase [Methanotrichaceae archaeon]